MPEKAALQHSDIFLEASLACNSSGTGLTECNTKSILTASFIPVRQLLHALPSYILDIAPYSQFSRLVREPSWSVKVPQSAGTG